MIGERDCSCTDPECDMCHPEAVIDSNPVKLPVVKDFSLDDIDQQLLKELQDAIDQIKKDFPDSDFNLPVPQEPPAFKPSYYLLEDIDVHTEHCCEKHKACKYGDLECTVATGQKKASYPCNCDHF
jgi:hypothetical protein